MRFLFCTRPYLGHLFPMVSLGRELASRGHHVLVASSEDLRSAVTEAGLGFQPAGCSPATASRLASDETGRTVDFASSVIQSKVSDLLQGPDADVVVREPTDLAAAVAAEARGIPVVTLGRSHFISAASWRRILAGDLDRVRAAAGLGPDPSLDRLFGNLYLDAVPPWFHPVPPDTPTLASWADDGYDGSSDLLSMQYPPAPYAYVTLGTVYHGDLDFFRIAVAALRRCGMSAVLSVGSAETAHELTPLAGKDIVITPFVSQRRVLCGASMVICHGGYSTVLGALRAGVPLLCVPRGSDQEGNAQQCLRLGVARRVGPAQWSVSAAAEAITALSMDPMIRRRTRSLADRAEHLPSTADAAFLLQELPGLLAERVDPVQRLKVIAERDASVNYKAVNRLGWQQLSRAGSESSRPLTATARPFGRAYLDHDGWLPWAQIQNVLCLGAGGGQQGPAFAGLGRDVVVVDLSDEQLRRDREAATLDGLNIETVQADMCDLAVLGERQFDLVYQPVSTCYVPDIARVFAQVAAVLRAGGWYWSQHYCAPQLQIDSDYPWDGSAYRISHRQTEGQPIPWSSQVSGTPIVINHYLHSSGAILGGICDSGFDITRVCEPPTAPGDSQPGEAAHLAGYFPPFLRILARRRAVPGLASSS